MNKIDKQWYNALKYLSRFTPKEVKELKKEKSKEYKRNVPENIEDSFHAWGFIQFDDTPPRVITIHGLELLRDLEEIRRKDLTLIASAIAVVISLVALAKSMG